MRARLYCPVGEVAVDQTFESEAVIGRSPACTVELSPGLLSAQHARIRWDEGLECYVLEDLGSSNGTKLDGEEVRDPMPLGHLHVITLAERFDLVFQDLDRCSARHARKSSQDSSVSRTNLDILAMPLPSKLRVGTTPPHEKTLLQKLNIPLPDMLRKRAEPQPEPTPDTKPASWTLEVYDEETGRPLRHRLRTGDNIVGRSSTTDIVVDSPEISRRHARLTVRDGRLFVHDLGSRNQTFVDETPIERETELTPGSNVRFGAVVARLLVSGGAE